MGRPTSDTEQISFRVPSAWIRRAEKLRDKLSKAASGAPRSRTDVLREAIAIGMLALEQRRDLAR